MERIVRIANYIIDNDSTIRDTAKYFGISKSLVHKDIHKKLKKVDLNRYEKVIKVLNKHNMNKHLLGGLATKIKYQRRYNEKEKCIITN